MNKEQIALIRMLKSQSPDRNVRRYLQRNYLQHNIEGLLLSKVLGLLDDFKFENASFTKMQIEVQQNMKMFNMSQRDATLQWAKGVIRHTTGETLTEQGYVPSARFRTDAAHQSW